LAGRSLAKAFFGVLQEVIGQDKGKSGESREISTRASLAIDEIVQQNRIVNWTRNADVQNRMKSAVEDYLFELQEHHGLALTFEEVDRVLGAVIDIARVRDA
jgi:type I restriction enzyme R subunit